MSTSIPIIATDSDPAKVAAVAIELFGHVEAARIAHVREVAYRTTGASKLAKAWGLIAAEIKLKSHRRQKRAPGMAPRADAVSDSANRAWNRAGAAYRGLSAATETQLSRSASASRGAILANSSGVDSECRAIASLRSAWASA